MSFQIPTITTILGYAFQAVLSGNVRIRKIFYLAVTLTIFGIITALLAEYFPGQKQLLKTIAAIFGIVTGLLILGMAGYQSALETRKYEIEVKELEEHARKHPTEPQAAWELARVKLESYLNRNLKQVSSIFILTLLVMLAGFCIIGYGVVRSFQSPDNFKPSIVATIAGIIVEFIAATFLFIYKSTIEQAREYMSILERINAVGMSVQILETIESNENGLRDRTRAEIATVLLSLYSPQQKRTLEISKNV